MRLPRVHGRALACLAYCAPALQFASARPLYTGLAHTLTSCQLSHLTPAAPLDARAPPPKNQTPFNVRRYFPSLYPPCLHVLRVDPDKLDTVKMDNLWAREGDDEETGLLLGALAPCTACRLCCGMP